MTGDMLQDDELKPEQQQAEQGPAFQCRKWRGERGKSKVCLCEKEQARQPIHRVH